MEKDFVKAVGTLIEQGSKCLTIADLLDSINDYPDHATFREKGVNTRGFLSFSLCN